MKYQFYAIVFDVAENTTPVGSSASPAKSFVTNIQKVTGISISPTGSVTKNIGESFTISATVSPSDANNKTINWNSTNTSVATVDSNGKVSCLAAGSTTITSTAADESGISTSLNLTVRNPINSLTLDKDQTTILKDGYTSTVTATTDPANYDGANISWTIADTSIATVTVSGKTATIKSTSKIGQTTLTVSAGRLSKTVNVSVVNFTTTTYEYTGSVQQVDLPAGTYKLEVWGAQGGWTDSRYKGGLGGYSTGNLNLISNIKLYIYVGQQGQQGATSSFGGGGIVCSTYGSSGGGASDVRIGTDSLYARVIVAGGGGGAITGNTDWTNSGSPGGGSAGIGGVQDRGTTILSAPGTQTSGGSYTACYYHGQTICASCQLGTFGAGGHSYNDGGSNGGGGRWPVAGMEVLVVVIE